MSFDISMTDAIREVESLDLDMSPYEDALNRSVVFLRGAAAQIDAATLVSLARARHVVDLTLSNQSWSTNIRSQGGGAFAVTTQDPPSTLFTDPIQIAALEQAMAADVVDVAEYLRLCMNLSAELKVEITNHPLTSGVEWYRTARALELDLTSATWLGLIGRFCGAEGKRVVTIQDAADSFVSAPGMLVLGPNADVRARTLAAVRDSPQIAEYRAQVMTGVRMGAPSPLDIAPRERKGLRDVEKLLNGVSEQLVWLWVAKSAWQSDSDIEVRYDGARVVEGPLNITPVDSASDALQLWEWATGSPGPPRSEAIFRSISLMAMDTTDLIGLARRVLISAESILEFMVHAHVAEASVARGAARDAGLSAARNAAEEAQSAAAKSFDRVVLQIVAIAGLLFANQQASFGSLSTRTLLWIIAGLIIVLGLIVTMVDFPSARAELATFKVDLALYFDSLTKQDLSDLLEMEALKEASRTIRRAQTLATVILLAGFGVDMYALTLIK